MSFFGQISVFIYMNKLSKGDQKLLLQLLADEIKESHFNSLRYHSESYYERTVSLQRIFNILSHEASDIERIKFDLF